MIARALTWFTRPDPIVKATVICRTPAAGSQRPTGTTASPPTVRTRARTEQMAAELAYAALAKPDRQVTA